MAIAFVNAVGNGYGAGGGDLTVAGTVNSGADFLVAIVHQFDTNNMASPAVTWNSDALTLVGTIQKAGSNNDWLGVYYLVNPDVGSFNLIADRTDSSRMQIASACYSGVSGLDSSTPVQGSGTSTSISSALVSVADNCWHVFNCIEFNGNATASVATVIRSANTANGGIHLFDSNSAKTPAGSLTQTVTTTPSSTFARVQFAMAPTAAAGPTTVKTFDGVTQSTGIKTYLGVATASVKTVDGAS